MQVRYYLKKKPDCRPGKGGMNRIETHGDIADLLELAQPEDELATQVAKNNVPSPKLKLPGFLVNAFCSLGCQLGEL
jgi:hypothetical protein